jgi:hypothetical protein
VAEPVSLPAGVDHAEWDRLLGEYVDERGLVDYGRWKANAADRGALASYLARFSAAGRAAEGQELAASGINAYNAFTVGWILDNYPTGSIRSLKDSFTARRHAVGGAKVSLDDIEHRTLRTLVGYRVHAALVCAARSCPPLRREAWRAQGLDAQLDAAMARWLAREDLNRFDPEEGRIRVSKIFDWFEDDFDRAGGVIAVLQKHGPASARETIALIDDVKYLDYDWSLNDQRSRR